jgi:hypothetical protein
MKRLAIVLASLLALNSVKADELSAIAHGFSYHLDNHGFNQDNYGVGLRFERDDIGIQTGTYYNSVRKDSVYALVDWSPLQTESFGCFKAEAGLFAGATTGYLHPVIPVAGLQSAIKCGNVFARVRVAPDPYYNSKIVGAVELGLTVYKF